jgi:hypothetical protein
VLGAELEVFWQIHRGIPLYCAKSRQGRRCERGKAW